MRAAELDLDLEVFAGPFDLLMTVVLREEIERPGEDLEVELERGGGHPPQASAVAGRRTVVACLFSSPR